MGAEKGLEEGTWVTPKLCAGVCEEENGLGLLPNCALLPVCVDLKAEVFVDAEKTGVAVCAT